MKVTVFMANVLCEVTVPKDSPLRPPEPDGEELTDVVNKHTIAAKRLQKAYYSKASRGSWANASIVRWLVVTG